MSERTRLPMRARAHVLAGLLALLAGCTAGPPSVSALAANDHARGTTGRAESRTAAVWTSYQIVVDRIDGEQADLRAEVDCAYYLLRLLPGRHVFELSLDYGPPERRVRSEAPVTLVVELQAGSAYTLLDLSADRRIERRFEPVLIDGAPADESLTLHGPPPSAR